MNNLYQKIIIAKVKNAIACAEAIGDLNNPLLKGRFREILIKDLFIPLLPSDIGVGNGVIITYDNKQSKEQDIVIYDRQILPPLLMEQNKGIFPIESVMYSIEIKSILNSAELIKSHESALDLSTFKYLTGQYDSIDKPIKKYNTYCLNSVLFAFSSDLTGDINDEIKRYDRIRKSSFRALKAICILNKGYWYYKETKGWVTFKTDSQYMEILGFLSGIMNTYRLIRKSRFEPRLGHYIIE